MNISKLGIVKTAKANWNTYRIRRADKIRRKQEADEWMEYIKSEFFDVEKVRKSQLQQERLKPIFQTGFLDMIKCIVPDVFRK